MDEVELYSSAIAAFSYSHQIIKAMEEMGELSHALGRYLLDNDVDTTLANVQEEIADVEIMMGQMKLYFGAAKVEAVKKFKLERLEKRIQDKEKQDHEHTHEYEHSSRSKNESL